MRATMKLTLKGVLLNVGVKLGHRLFQFRYLRRGYSDLSTAFEKVRLRTNHCGNRSVILHTRDAE